jgi:N-acyl-D-aspartate/D-glutamate deacylase
MTDLLFTDVLVADHDQRALIPRDVRVAGRSVVDVSRPGSLAPFADERHVRGGGRILSAGFIDAHSHADSAPFLDHVDDSKLSQGVTSEVVGNCGFSLAPAPPARRQEIRALTGRIFPDLPFDWETVRDLYARTDAHGYAVNQVPLLGHSTVRSAVVGGDDRPPTAVERDGMVRALLTGLEAGAWGLSSGLIYPPGMYAAPEELVALVNALPEDAVYTTHMRGEGRQLLASLQEALSVAEKTGARLQVSHLKAAGRGAWGLVPKALALIDAAVERGVRVGHDVYPYRANSTMLSSCLPPWFHDGGHHETMRRLSDPAALARAERELGLDDGTWENWVGGSGWDSVLVASTATHRDEGLTLAEVAARRGVTPFEALITILLENDLAASMCVFAMSEDDVDAAISHPRAMIGSDGLPPGTGGKPHPRLYGTFTRVLAHYVRERGVLDWFEAIEMMTSRPAGAFGLRGRGVIRPGSAADLVLLDPDRVGDTATFTNPVQRSTGIDLVVIGGVVAYEDGEPTGVRAGQRLRRPGPPGHPPH